MPTDLAQQLPRFAEALDVAAPAISVDEILGRATVVVEVETLERPARDVSRLSRLPWGDLVPQHDNGGEGDEPIELATSPGAELPVRPRVVLKIALAAAAVVLLVALTSIVQIGDDSEPADVPSTVPTPRPSTDPTAPPSTMATIPPTTTAPLASGGMWPQSTLEEVRAAQERADAGDPDYVWQVAARLSDDDPGTHVEELELVDRFLREVLGWEAYLFNAWQGDTDGDGWEGGAWTDQRYLRCAPGRTNPLYPPGPDSQQPGESCAPTIDDLHYESVRLDLAQLDRQGRDGVWVVNRWELTAPFAQADPAIEEARATERVEDFLVARVAGSGAEGLVQTHPDMEIPLLYATSSGVPYQRYEIERVGGPHWPDGRMSFSTRLFTDDDATVVEQRVTWDRSQSGGLWTDGNETTENGQPITISYTSSDGDVTVSAPSTWEAWLPGTRGVPIADGEVVEEDALHVWSGGLWRREDLFGSGDRIGFVDPVGYDAWCAANGGSPLLTGPADAAAIAQQVVADPDFETTEPIAVRVGDLDALSMDVTLAPGGQACGIGMIEISRWVHEIGDDPGLRLRLYLVDLPDGMSVPTLAITIVAPEERFDEVIAETAPIIESIEFHPQPA